MLLLRRHEMLKIQISRIKELRNMIIATFVPLLRGLRVNIFEWTFTYFSIYIGPWAYPTLARNMATAAAEVKKLHELCGKGLVVQQGIDVALFPEGPFPMDWCCAELASDAFVATACINSFSTEAWWRNCSNRSWFWRFHFVLMTRNCSQ